MIPSMSVQQQGRFRTGTIVDDLDPNRFPQSIHMRVAAYVVQAANSLLFTVPLFYSSVGLDQIYMPADSHAFSNSAYRRLTRYMVAAFEMSTREIMGMKNDKE